MGFDSECGEVPFEDFDPEEIGKIEQEHSDRMSKMQVRQDVDDDVPVVVLSDSDDNVNQVLDDGTSKTHACPYEDCKKVFRRSWWLARHIQVHRGMRPFKCEVPGCEKSYCHSNHLARHVKMKHYSTPMYTQFYKCPHPGCFKELSNECNLKRHYQRKHKQKYPFICYCCDKGFLKHNQLQAHLYQHTGVAPFKCTTCDTGFTSQSILKRHQKRHKTYTCECGQEFKYWTLLQAHIKLTHPAGSTTRNRISVTT
ncbi:Transcription factor IIIA [Zootermopsis nevadensis]|uniref:Transcription factor IIIA n=1 Tax=Zootermopsis nevadensis TaxID=136037 RepID=A0A067RH76_ZOONE|nr:Transcription factor IIIA [Zootermopsis nevadensis]